MQSFRILQCFVVVQRLHITYCFICKSSVLFTALYAKVPYYVVLYMHISGVRVAPARGQYVPTARFDEVLVYDLDGKTCAYPTAQHTRPAYLF